MDHCVGKLFASGKTRLQIERALGSIPYVWILIFVLIFVLQLVHSDQKHHLRYFKETIEAVRLAHAMGSEVLILSDANTWYIESILKSLNIDNLFGRDLESSYMEGIDMSNLPLSSRITCM